MSLKRLLAEFVYLMSEQSTSRNTWEGIEVLEKIWGNMTKLIGLNREDWKLRKGDLTLKSNIVPLHLLPAPAHRLPPFLTCKYSFYTKTEELPSQTKLISSSWQNRVSAQGLPSASSSKRVLFLSWWHSMTHRDTPGDSWWHAWWHASVTPLSTHSPQIWMWFGFAHWQIPHSHVVLGGHPA